VPNVYARTIKRAAEIVGGEVALAKRLSVSPDKIAHWIEGRETPHTSVFLKAVDIISEHKLANTRSPDKDQK